MGLTFRLLKACKDKCNRMVFVNMTTTTSTLVPVLCYFLDKDHVKKVFQQTNLNITVISSNILSYLNLNSCFIYKSVKSVNTELILNTT